ncbi:MAG: diguanylate cyclase [Firmicutes bacterium HGW-Firmicutes-15]|nr:MAG: diguanylate cyclase [Firmicutes bacterium HGW-Firmicutes-15]
MRYEEDRTKEQIISELHDLHQVNKKLQNQIDESLQILDEYRDLFYNAMDIIYIHDMEGKIINVNKAAEQMFNYITGLDKITSILELISQEEYQKIMQEIRAEITPGATVSYELELQTKDKVLVYLEVNLRQIYKNNLVYAIHCVARDISKRKNMERALRESEQKFNKVFYLGPDPIVITENIQGYMVEVNDAWVEYSGYTREEALGHNCVELGLMDIESLDLMANMILAQGYMRNFEIVSKMKSGELKTSIFSAELIEIDGEKYVIVISKDISDRKRIEAALLESESNFRTLANTAPVLISVVDSNHRFLYANTTYLQACSLSYEQCMKSKGLDFIHPDYRDMVIKCSAELLLADIKGPDRIQFKMIGNNNEDFWVDRSASIIQFNGQQAILSIALDITESRIAEDNIKYLSFHDKLTGLFNRAFFEEELKRLDNERHIPLSIIMGDVNGLKIINDAFGHYEGDKLLVSAAKILTDLCRQDDIVARWGGDEFIILLPSCDYEAASKIFERINKGNLNINEASIQASISLGMASKTSANMDVKNVIKEAEDNMYRNKLMESRSARSSFITSLEKTLWTRSHETEEHCQRMLKMAQKIGKIINLNGIEMNNLKLITRLHDIGKIAIPNSILNKPGELSAEEWELIKKHPEIGYRIALSSPELAPIAETILYHHEHWDGTGYPFGLKGENIPLISRIIALADAYDVMINGRTYKRALDKTEVWVEIERCSGTQFDPSLVKKIKDIL